MAKFDEADLQLFCNYLLGKNTAGNFEKDWVYTLRFHLNQDDQHIDFPIKGTSLVPKLSISQTYLEFPSIPMQHRHKKSIKIENYSSKGITVDLENSANYSFQPQKLKIQSKGSAKVDVVFCPKIMGELNEICCLTAGVFSFPIKLFGKSIFGTKGDNSICEEVPVEALEKS